MSAGALLPAHALRALLLQAAFEVAATAEMVDLAGEMAEAALENVVLAEGPESPRAELLCQCVEACA